MSRALKVRDFLSLVFVTKPLNISVFHGPHKLRKVNKTDSDFSLDKTNDSHGSVPEMTSRTTSRSIFEIIFALPDLLSRNRPMSHQLGRGPSKPTVTFGKF